MRKWGVMVMLLSMSACGLTSKLEDPPADPDGGLVADGGSLFDDGGSSACMTCGDGCAKKCGLNMGCATNSDCASGVCENKHCGMVTLGIASNVSLNPSVTVEASMGQPSTSGAPHTWQFTDEEACTVWSGFPNATTRQGVMVKAMSLPTGEKWGCDGYQYNPIHDLTYAHGSTVIAPSELEVWLTSDCSVNGYNWVMVSAKALGVTCQ